MTEIILSEGIEPFVPELLGDKFQKFEPQRAKRGMEVAVLYDPIDTNLRRYRTGKVKGLHYTRHGDCINIEEQDGTVTLLQPYSHHGLITGYDVFDRTEGEKNCIGELLAFYSNI